MYDLMDSAYDMPEIKEYSLRLNHVPLIDVNPRRDTELKKDLELEGKARKTLNWKPAEAIRYNERTAAERTNAPLRSARTRRRLPLWASLRPGRPAAVGAAAAGSVTEQRQCSARGRAARCSVAM